MLMTRRVFDLAICYHEFPFRRKNMLQFKQCLYCLHLLQLLPMLNVYAAFGCVLIMKPLRCFSILYFCVINTQFV